MLLVLARNTDKCSTRRSSKTLALIVIPCATVAVFNPLFAVAFTNVITVLYTTHTTYGVVSLDSFFWLLFCFWFLRTLSVFLFLHSCVFFDCLFVVSLFDFSSNAFL